MVLTGIHKARISPDSLNNNKSKLNTDTSLIGDIGLLISEVDDCIDPGDQSLYISVLISVRFISDKIGTEINIDMISIISMQDQCAEIDLC